jgi:hypothetical protein
MFIVADIVKPKRGRRSKKDILAASVAASIINNNLKLNVEELFITVDELENGVGEGEGLIEKGLIEEGLIEEGLIEDVEKDVDIEKDIKPAAKKRGRKPKGGKIIQQKLTNAHQCEPKPNIILHLKCSVKDMQIIGDYNSNYTCTNIESYQFSGTKNELSYEIINNPNDIDESPVVYNEVCEEDNCESKEIWKKLKVLEHNLHINNISDKKSACFWCSYDFDNPPIFIPKHFIKNSYHVYGCFCTPECAVAHLMEENIDSSTKFERYYLMNHIYSKIYQYKKNIKPAPNPYYMLDKFYGNLTIQEYRSLLKSERLFLIVDKPLTRILPEFHEDNDDFIINNKIIPSNNYQLKKRLQKKQSQSKNNIVNEHFGINN